MPPTQKKGSFETALPIAGFIVNTIASVSTSVIDYIAMRIVSKNAETSIVMGTIGAIAGIILNWLVFLFSNARHDYAQIGKAIDQRRCVKSELDSVESNACSYKLVLIRLGLSGSVLTTCVLDSISQFQEIQSIGVTARSQNIDFPEEVAFWFGLFLASVSFTAEFVTFNSFANLAVIALEKRRLAQSVLPVDVIDAPVEQHRQVPLLA